jgi:ATP-dependent Clp protease protease subunit
MKTKLKPRHNNNERNRNSCFDWENPSRTLILSGEIDDFSVSDAMQVISDINEFDDENEAEIKEYIRKPIKLIINSVGGSVYDGFGLIGVIETSKTPVHTYCYGSSMSMSLLILVSGHKRFAHRLSTLMYHECYDDIPYEKLTTLTENIEETKRIMKVYDDFLIEKTTIKRKQIDDVKKGKLDWYITPADALKYSIIDEII